MANIVTDADKIIKLMHRQLSLSGWFEPMYLWWTGKKFRDIIEHLTEQEIVPKFKDFFYFLDQCPYDTVKGVMLCDHWANSSEMNCGIPFCRINCKEKHEITGKEIVSAKGNLEFFKPFLTKRDEFNQDIRRWCKQGLLMIPHSVTCRHGGNPHYDLWSEFRPRLIEAIEEANNNLPWLLIGVRTWKYEDLIKSKHTSLMSIYPKLDNENWDKTFNKKLVALGKEPIIWS